MTTVTVQSGKNLQQTITAGSHQILADEPLEAGGDDAGLDPYALLLASLGACTSMTLQLYAKHKQWELKSVKVVLRHEKIHAADCTTCETREGKLDRIWRQIHLEGNLTTDQIVRLRDIAKRCPVHRTLTSEISIVDE